jgi:hypothetical protein
MFKNIIAPVQAWLLSQGKCVGCGAPLSQGTAGKAGVGEGTVVCKCRRVYVRAGNGFRRARMDEV